MDRGWAFGKLDKENNMKVVKKTSLLLIALLLVGVINAQEKLYTKEGQLTFEASVASFEPVAATHNGATAVLDTATGKIAALALVRGFRFENALMEEHFNENYIESTSFPKASFRGNIVDFDSSFKGQKTFTVQGKLTIREKTIDIEAEASMSMEDGLVVFATTFEVKPEDFDIKIPKVVGNKIAKTITVTANFDLLKKA